MTATNKLIMTCMIKAIVTYHMYYTINEHDFEGIFEQSDESIDREALTEKFKEIFGKIDSINVTNDERFVEIYKNMYGIRVNSMSEKELNILNEEIETMTEESLNNELQKELEKLEKRYKG